MTALIETIKNHAFISALAIGGGIALTWLAAKVPALVANALKKLIDNAYEKGDDLDDALLTATGKWVIGKVDKYYPAVSREAAITSMVAYYFGKLPTAYQAALASLKPKIAKLLIGIAEAAELEVKKEIEEHK